MWSDIMTAKMGGCFRRFLEDADTQHFWRSINEITEALKKEQDILFKCEIFMSKKLKKNYIIVCKKYFCKFLIEDECYCQMTEGNFFQFWEECFKKVFSDNCLNLGLELIKWYSRYKFFKK